MFIKSNTIHHSRPAMAHALAKAAFEGVQSMQKGGALAGKIGDAFIKSRAKVVNDWTAHITTQKNIKLVSALMA